MTYLISEISSNHNRDIDRVENLIKESKKLDDAVKFQLLKLINYFQKKFYHRQKNILIGKDGNFQMNLFQQ